MPVRPESSTAARSSVLAHGTCLLLTLGLVGCGSSGPTYAEVAPIIESNCVGCHRDGAIAPFPLTTYDEVFAVKELVADAVASGRMPPWQASDECNQYQNNTDLTPDSKQMLLDWLDGGAKQGRHRTEIDAKPAVPFTPDLTLPLPEPYTPTQLDDYRCQIIETGLTEPAWVTGFAAIPDRADLVHHVIAYRIDADKRERFDAMDAEFEGVGWPCYGSAAAPGFDLSEIDLADVPIGDLLEMFENGEAIDALGGFGWLGSWAPGSTGGFFPPDTGIAIAPGDFIVVQMHYNTAAGAGRDQSSIGITLADTVRKPAITVPYTDPAWVADLPFLGDPMTIPAGSTNTTHSTGLDGDGPLFVYVRSQLDLPEGTPVSVHSVAHHMHTLGKTGRQTVVHGDGTETCLLDIPDWDFDWQSRYELAEPVTIGLDDEIVLTCSWDNSASNQPVVDGVIAEPVDVAWGEGTRDEMCLGILYLTGP
ncbi:MAG: hypothetical protein R3F61_28040 [Myxococcota bacterium]